LRFLNMSRIDSTMGQRKNWMASVFISASSGVGTSLCCRS
jgi:hypothetical protein